MKALVKGVRGAFVRNKLDPSVPGGCGYGQRLTFHLARTMGIEVFPKQAADMTEWRTRMEPDGVAHAFCVVVDFQRPYVVDVTLFQFLDADGVMRLHSANLPINVAIGMASQGYFCMNPITCAVYGVLVWGLQAIVPSSDPVEEFTSWAFDHDTDDLSDLDCVCQELNLHCSCPLDDGYGE
jgi:hypothetical protein